MSLSHFICCTGTDTPVSFSEGYHVLQNQIKQEQITYVILLTTKRCMVYCSMHLSAIILILNCFIDYANCNTSTSSSCNSSIDKAGTHSAISSKDILPFLINFIAVLFAIFCVALSSISFV